MNFLTERESSLLDDEKDDIRHEEDSDNEKAFDDDVSLRNNFEETIPEPSIRSKGNTGVKGVLADYAAHKELRRVELELENLKATWKTRQLLGNDKKGDIDKAFEELRVAAQEQKKDENHESDSEDDLDDDEFFKEYKQKRMQEIQAAAFPTFGFLRKISQEEFLDVIDNESPNVFVLIHLYQDYIPACVTLNRCLQSLAPKFPYTKFLKIISSDAQESFDEIALPTLLVYKGGDLVTCWVRLTDSLGQTFDVDHVEKFLKKAGVLTTLALPRPLKS